jgi:hypothetical protein
MDQAAKLVESKAITISKLMVLVPPGTLDPTPHLYDTTMYSMAGLMSLAVVAHAFVRPVEVPVKTASISEPEITQVKTP